MAADWHWHERWALAVPISTGVVVAALVAATGEARPILLASAFATLLLLLIRADFAMQALVVVLWLNLSDLLIQGYDAPSLDKALVPVAAAAALLRWWAQGRRLGGDRATFAMLAIYAASVAASLLVALDDMPVRAGLLDLIKHMTIMLLVVALVTDLGAVRKLVWAFVVAGLLLGATASIATISGLRDLTFGGLAGHAVFQIVGEINSDRLVGPLDDPNAYAQVLVALVPFAWNRMLDGGSRAGRSLAAAALVLLVGAVAATYSRSGMLTLAIVSAFLLGLWHRRHLARVLVVVILVAVVAALLAPQAYRDRMTALVGLAVSDDGPKDVALRGRRDEMLAALAMAADHPALGVGVGNYQSNFQGYSRRLGLLPRQEDRQAHSLYLEVAAERGMIGLAAFAALIVFVVGRGWRASRRLRACGRDEPARLVEATLAALGAYLVFATVLHGTYAQYFWLLIGAVLAAAAAAKSNEKESA
jgi:putative inorganic carbon (HCO3(-)) transporter